MDRIVDMTSEDFVSELASKSPSPGGGGASALVGAIGMALGSMNAALTIGKEKYKNVEAEVADIAHLASKLQERLLSLVDEDARAFEPLSRAYGMPSATEEEKALKAEVMEKCLHEACEVPLDIMRACCEAIELQGRLSKVGSSIAISDVGCGAVICKAALQAASLNVFVNTRLMKDSEHAQKCNAWAMQMIEEYGQAAEDVFVQVEERLL